jgi:hypothetical protein
MWQSFIQVYLTLITLFSLLAIGIPEHDRYARQQLAANVAQARADNLALGNTTNRIIGPQLYEAPLLCVLPDLIIPRAFGVRLGPGHSISEHQVVLDKDVRPFIRDVFRMEHDELVYTVSDVDDQLLRAIRSDPMVILVTCSVYDDYPWTTWQFE